MTDRLHEPIAVRSAGPSAPGTLKALLQADITAQARNGRSLLLGFLPPLVVLYGLSAGKRGAVLGDPIFRVAAALTLGIALTALLGYTNSVARDRERGVFQRLRVTPAPTWCIMVSRLIVQIISVLAMAVVVLIAADLIQNISLSAGAYALTIVGLIVGAAVFLSIGQAVVGLVSSADTVNAAGRLLLIPLFTLGLFAHTDILGTTIEMIGRWSPGGNVITLLEGTMEPARGSADTWWALLVCLGYAVVFAIAGIRWFRWTTR